MYSAYSEELETQILTKPGVMIECIYIYIVIICLCNADDIHVVFIPISCFHVFKLIPVHLLTEFISVLQKTFSTLKGDLHPQDEHSLFHNSFSLIDSP